MNHGSLVHVIFVNYEKMWTRIFLILHVNQTFVNKIFVSQTFGNHIFANLKKKVLNQKWFTKVGFTVIRIKIFKNSSEPNFCEQYFCEPDFCEPDFCESGSHDFSVKFDLLFTYFHSSQKSREPVNHGAQITQAPYRVSGVLKVIIYSDLFRYKYSA